MATVHTHQKVHVRLPHSSLESRLCDATAELEPDHHNAQLLGVANLLGWYDGTRRGGQGIVDEYGDVGHGALGRRQSAAELRKRACVKDTEGEGEMQQANSCQGGGSGARA